MPSLTLTFQISSLLRRPSPTLSPSPSRPPPAFPPIPSSLPASSCRPRFRSCFSPQSCVSVASMAELVHDADKLPAEVADGEVDHCRTFLDAGSHEELLSGIRNLAEGGKLPPNVAAGMEELFHTYKNAHCSYFLLFAANLVVFFPGGVFSK